MGYQINSPWTELRKDDIKRLNEIIDDEYCNELEIGRKLNIMKVFEKELQKEIDDFNFETVIKFMESVGWKWYHYNNGNSYYGVPTKADIINSIKTAVKHGLYNIIELNEKNYCVCCGGIVLDMGITAKYASNDNCYLNIYFDIAHFLKD